MGGLVGASRIRTNLILNGKEAVSLQRVLDMAQALGIKLDVTIKRGRK